MTGREIHIHITLTRRSFIVLGVVLALLAGGVVFAVVGTGDASAAATGNALCVTASGSVARRTACLTGERTLAAGTYETSPLTAQALKNGPNRMPMPRAATVEGRIIDEPEPPEVILDATQFFQSSLYAFTVRFDVPANWVGLLKGVCPDWAPMFVTGAYYSPEWQPIVAQGLGVANLNNNPTEPDSYMYELGAIGIGRERSGQVWVRRTESTLNGPNGVLAQADRWDWPRSPAAPFTLYVTQVCGSIVALTPTG
jgi:hypothetical protein